MKKLLLLTLTTLLACFPATAQDAQTGCPDTALIAMLNMKSGVEAGTVTDIQQVFQMAEAGLTRCADNPDVQAVTAHLFNMIGESLPPENIDDRFLVYSKAYEAFQNSDTYFDRDKTPVGIPIDGQEPFKFYNFNSASGALRVTIARLAELQMSGKTHPAFDLKACPFKYQGRINDEREGYRSWLNQKSTKYQGNANPRFEYQKIAVTRLEGIWEYCTTFRRNHNLTFVLADYYFKMAKHLKDSDPEQALAYAYKAKIFAGRNENAERGKQYSWGELGGNHMALDDLLEKLSPTE